MPSPTDNISIADSFLKRSAKLLPCQKEMCHFWHNKGLSINKIAKMFQVNKRTIQFILYPERLKKNLELRKDRGGSMVYYKKESHTASIKDHRKYKKELFSNEKNKHQ